MGFFDTYKEEPGGTQSADAAPSRQGDTSGVCDFCGFASDDVLLGVCAGCVDEGSQT